MHGFKIAIATRDGDQSNLITIGTDIGDNQDDGSEEEATMIESVEIFFDTTDNNVRQKTGSMLAKIEFKGKIPKAPGLTTKLQQLSEWAHDRSSETSYRDICIAVKAVSDKFQIVYTIKNVFVVDYKEVYVCDGSGGDEKDHFELRLTQKENHLDKIDISRHWPTDGNFGRKS